MTASIVRALKPFKAYREKSDRHHYIGADQEVDKGLQNSGLSVHRFVCKGRSMLRQNVAAKSKPPKEFRRGLIATAAVSPTVTSVSAVAFSTRVEKPEIELAKMRERTLRPDCNYSRSAKQHAKESSRGDKDPFNRHVMPLHLDTYGEMLACVRGETVAQRIDP